MKLDGTERIFYKLYRFEYQSLEPCQSRIYNGISTVF